MSTRFLGGIISATPPTVSTSSAPGVWSLEQALQYIKAGNWPVAITSDPYFKYVTMLLHGDGTNGAQNNTFLDSSVNNFNITRNGNTTQGSFSPYGSNWSNYFGGSGAVIYATETSSQFTFGTGDYTYECWIYPTTDASTQRTIFGRTNTGNTSFPYIYLVTTTSVVSVYYSSTIVSGSTAIPSNTWTHIVVSRLSGTTRIFVNGTQDGSASDTANLTSPTAVMIGGSGTAAANPFVGYISNARILKGTGYSSVTVPTAPLTAITNTSLLTCQSNRFIDNSTNNFAITVNGTPSVQRFSPFSPASAYSTSVIGGSGYFDGSGDYLSMTSGTSLGSGDFTISCWVYLTAAPGGETPVGCSYNYYTAGNNGNFVFRVGTTNLWRSFDGQGNLAAVDGSFTWQTNTWIHMAWVRSGTTVTVYRNGVSLGSTTDSKTLSNSSNGYFIGHDRINGAIAGYITGYIADFRVVVGSAITSVPTAPTTAISGTSLLCSMTNGAIFDNAMMNNLETVGNAQISTAQSKFGGSSMSFNGTNSGLYTASTPNLAFGSGDFTVEGWVYFNANLPYLDGDSLYSAALFGQTNTNGLALVFKSGSSSGAPSNLAFTVIGASTVNTTISTSLNTWYHIAVTKASGTVRVFLNGVQQNSFANSTTFAQSVGTVGYLNIASFNDWFPGYIDDFRITKGYARYTSNFTPPTAAFPNQ